MTAAGTRPGGTFTMGGDLTVTRRGYGAMQLAGPGQLGGQRPAEPVGRTGDKNDFPAEFGHSPTVPRQAPAAPPRETMACWSASEKEMT